MAYSDSKYKINTGDFKINANIGTTRTKEAFSSMGAFGKGKRNERGDCFDDSAEEHKLAIANNKTCYTTHKKSRNTAWFYIVCAIPGAGVT